MAHSLFAELARLHLFTTAVLNHDLPGYIYVDNVYQPKSGFMSTKELQFLAGDPDNEPFNIALKQIFQQTIFVGNAPEATLTEIDLTFIGDSWLHRLETLFGDWRWPPIPNRTRHYRFKEMKLNWREIVPAGYTVQPLAEFGERDFGFCAVADGCIVCTCATDVISGTACEIGIETHPNHYRRGLATVTAAATIEYALRQGFQDIWWICSDDNPGSIGTAEKVGFEKQFESNGYFFILDETEHKRQVQNEHR